MQVHRHIETLPQFNNAVVTIGTFDGVHTGHRQIINQLKEEAKRIQGESIIISFHPHPRTVVSVKPVHLLNTINEKISLLEELKIDHLVIVPFNESFSNQSPDEYVKQFLFERFHPHTIIIGYDHKFGKNRKGDYHLLEKYGAKLGFIVKEIPEKVINEAIVSSTIIRKALLDNDIENANKFLGYNYFFEGIVVDGNKLGRTLGYPTANIVIHDKMKLIPADGIYAAEAEIVDNNNNSQIMPGMMSIGMRPTVDGKSRTIEMNIFNFEKDIYGKTLKVYVHKYLRPEVKYDTLDALQAQMLKDKAESLNYFSNLKR